MFEGYGDGFNHTTVDGPISLVKGFILSGGYTASALEKAKTTLLLVVAIAAAVLVTAAVGAAVALVAALERLLRGAVLLGGTAGGIRTLGHLYLGQSK